MLLGESTLVINNHSNERERERESVEWFLFSLRFDNYFWIACCFIFCCSLLNWRSIMERIFHTFTRVHGSIGQRYKIVQYLFVCYDDVRSVCVSWMEPKCVYEIVWLSYSLYECISTHAHAHMHTHKKVMIETRRKTNKPIYRQ